MAEELTRALTALAERGEERGAAHVLESAWRQAGLDPKGRRLSPYRWRRGVLVAATAAAVVLVLIGVVTILGPFAGEETPVAQPSGDWVAGQPIEVGERPGSLVSGFGSLWVATSEAVVRIDPTSGEVICTIPVAAATDLVVTGDSVWVLSLSGGGRRDFEDGSGFTTIGAVTRIDPLINAVDATVPVGAGPESMALVGEDIWVVDMSDATVTIIDPQSDAVIEVLQIGAGPDSESIMAITAIEGRPWLLTAVASDDPEGRSRLLLRQYNPSSRRLEATINLGGQFPEGKRPTLWGPDLNGAAGDLWMSAFYVDPIGDVGVVYRFAGNSGELLASIPIGRGWGGSIAYDDGLVYATDCHAATVTAIDVATNQVVGDPFPVGRPAPDPLPDYDWWSQGTHSCPDEIIVVSDTLYVSLENEGTVLPIKLNPESGTESQPIDTEAVPGSCAACVPGTMGETTTLEIGDGFVILDRDSVRAADPEKCPRGCWVPSFRVTNTGSQIHHIQVLVDWGGQDPANLPVGGSEMGAMEGRVYGYSAISSGGEIRLQPGQTMDGFPLEPGEYLLICDEAGHYSAGEYALLTVLEPTGEPPASRGLTLGELAPSWEATLLAGTPVSTASLLGRPSLLVVWGGESMGPDWWPQIEQTLSELEDAATGFRNEVNAWAVAIGIPAATVEEQTSGYTFPVVVDEERRIPEVWGGAPWAFPTNQPTVVLLDSAGLVARVLDHPPQPGELNDLLEWITNSP
jgi:hypothetical protein